MIEWTHVLVVWPKNGRPDLEAIYTMAEWGALTEADLVGSEAPRFLTDVEAAVERARLFARAS